MLEQFNRIDDAVACHREAIRHDEWVVAHARESEPIRMVLAWRRTELADLLMGARRTDEARTVLDLVTEELMGRAQGANPRSPEGMWLAGGLRHLAKKYRDGLGDGDRAEQLAAVAAAIEASMPEGWPGHHDDEGPAPTDGRSRAPGRRPPPR